VHDEVANGRKPAPPTVAERRQQQRHGRHPQVVGREQTRHAGASSRSSGQAQAHERPDLARDRDGDDRDQKRAEPQQAITLKRRLGESGLAPWMRTARHMVCD
jgi:hypothetical protein